MLVSMLTYRGLPAEIRADLERVYQVTLTTLYTKAKQLAEKQLDIERSYGDADFMITKSADGFLLTDSCSGWWAVVRWSESKYERVFWIHSKVGAPPEHIDWARLDEDFWEGRSAYHIQASRGADDRPWYSQGHNLDLKHPLLYVLGLALDELQ